MFDLECGDDELLIPTSIHESHSLRRNSTDSSRNSMSKYSPKISASTLPQNEPESKPTEIPIRRRQTSTGSQDGRNRQNSLQSSVHSSSSQMSVGMLGKPNRVTRQKSSSITDGLVIENDTRNRSATSSNKLTNDDKSANNVEEYYPEETGFVDIVKAAVKSNTSATIGHIWMAWLPQIKSRVLFYSMALTVLSLVLFGQAGSSNPHNIPSKEWYKFGVFVMIIDISSLLLSEVIFAIIDMHWTGPEEIRFYINCLNGPLSFMMTISIISGTMSDMTVPRSFTDFDKVVSTAITICALFTLRKFYQRYNYNRIMENRFSDRLATMSMEASILSALACWSFQSNSDQRPESHPSTFFSLQSSIVSNPLHSEADKVEDTDEVIRNEEHDKAIEKLRNTIFAKRLIEMVEKQRAGPNLKDIFAEIVESSTLEEEEEEEILHESNKKTFWSRVNSVSHGTLRLQTINGKLIIRTKDHLTSFVDRLYKHLSRNDRRTITGEAMSNIIRNNKFEGYENANVVLLHAHSLFGVDDTILTTVTKERLHDVCSTIYKTHRYAAASLSDFGELQKSLALVMDVLFWIFMIIVANIILQFDTLTIFAPLLTVIFGVSFALGPTVGNVCMAIGFLLFMLPYDVGDRVAIGYGTNKIVGNIASITLLQTTITTIYNEKV